MKVDQFIMDLEAPRNLADELLVVLVEAEFEEAIDVAMIEECMFPKILGNRMHLADTLRIGVARARPWVDGWARAVSHLGVRAGSFLWRGLCLAKPPPRAAPVPGDPPATRSWGGRPGLKKGPVRDELAPLVPPAFSGVLH